MVFVGMIFRLAAEGAGRNSNDSPEAVLKVVAAVKAAVYSNFCNIVIGSNQHLTGLADTDVVYIFFKG